MKKKNSWNSKKSRNLHYWLTFSYRNYNRARRCENQQTKPCPELLYTGAARKTHNNSTQNRVWSRGGIRRSSTAAPREKRAEVFSDGCKFLCSSSRVRLNWKKVFLITREIKPDRIHCNFRLRVVDIFSTSRCLALVRPWPRFHVNFPSSSVDFCRWHFTGTSTITPHNLTVIVVCSFVGNATTRPFGRRTQHTTANSTRQRRPNFID